jgi:organic radical activating enzyme
MFGTNRIHGQKTFQDAPANSLLVHSIFFTLQGEGPFAGRRAVFVRLAHCNLACAFCDTAFGTGEWKTFDEIELEAQASLHWAPAYGSKEDVILVVTGGEPALQSNLTPFLLHQSGKWDEIQIESNGTIERLLPLGVTLVVSPKCAVEAPIYRSQGRSNRYFVPSEAVLMRADCLKFVVSADPNSPYHEVPAWASGWAHQTGRPIYVSPMMEYPDTERELMLRDEQGAPKPMWEMIGSEPNRRNHLHAAQLCLRYGFRLSLQTHLYVELP